MKIWSVSLCLALFLTGCTSQQPQTSATPESVAAASSEMFSDRDWDDSYAPIYIREADKVFLTLAPGSENTLSNSGTYTQQDDHNVDAPLFCRSDLTLNGTGSLTVESPGGHGVVCKDDLVVTGGTYTITAASHGLSANDSVRIGGGTFTVTSGKDGIQSQNDEDSALDFDGSAVITDGTVVAAGPNQMAQTFGASSTQGSALLSVGSQQANTTVTLSDEAGNSLLSWDIPAAYTCVVVSCPQMTVGSSYTLTAGEFSTSFTLEDITYSSASGGAMGQPGGNTGGMGGQRPGGSMGGGPGSTPPDSASGGTMP